MSIGAAPRVIASTTSHKRESLLPTLEIFSALGLRDLELNLHHVLEEGVAPSAIADAVARLDLRLWVLSGGWCDFFHEPPDVDRTFASVASQVELANRFGVRLIRLFFGRLSRQAYGPDTLATITGNLRRLSDQHTGVTFVFENHDGASLVPEYCAEILDRVDRANIRMNFDPINFAKAGVDPDRALAIVRPFVAHVHLKGLSNGEYCEYGDGDVDLGGVIRTLTTSGYEGFFNVEYEGREDATLHLWQSVRLARRQIQDL